MKLENGCKRFIASDPGIQGGRPVFRGTRIPVATVLELLGSGMTLKEVLRGYPPLTKRAIQAAIRFAALRIQNEEFVPLVKSG